jgi:hypothetical protein
MGDVMKSESAKVKIFLRYHRVYDKDRNGSVSNYIICQSSWVATGINIV